MNQYIVTAIISSLISVLVFATISLTQQKTGTYLPVPNKDYIINTETGELIKKSELREKARSSI
tara:strand:- start:4324 stop:4515 length:192 start_codon:yes stop_codon:yes gene_type:complete